MIGDGEFQEGQIFEALQTTSHQNLNDLIVIMDHNKIQSSQYVDKIISLGNLQNKIKSFGWHVERCDGHDFKKLDKIFIKFSKIKNKPKFLIADTIKGRGVKFMEHTQVMKKQKKYNWHAGAPSDLNFKKAQSILLFDLKKILKKRNIQDLKLTNIALKKKEKVFEIH